MWTSRGLHGCRNLSPPPSPRPHCKTCATSESGWARRNSPDLPNPCSPTFPTPPSPQRQPDYQENEHRPSDSRCPDYETNRKRDACFGHVLETQNNSRNQIRVDLGGVEWGSAGKTTSHARSEQATSAKRAKSAGRDGGNRASRARASTPGAGAPPARLPQSIPEPTSQT